MDLEIGSMRNEKRGTRTPLSAPFHCDGDNADRRARIGSKDRRQPNTPPSGRAPLDQIGALDGAKPEAASTLMTPSEDLRNRISQLRLLSVVFTMSKLTL